MLPEATEEAPVEEAPVEEAPVEEAAVEEAPAEVAVAEEAVTEEAPGEAAAPEAAEPEATEATTAAQGEELPSGAEGGVTAAELETGADVDAGLDDVVVTEAPVEVADAAELENTEAVGTPAAEETTAAEETAPVEEAPVEEAPAEEAPAEEAPATDAAPVEEEAAAPAAVPAFMASADAEAGASVFRRCQSCHVLDEGVNRTGPSLYGVVGRDIGSVDGYNYSSAMAERGGQWTYENLDGFLENPRGWLPGTKMGYAGLRSQEDRANVIAYIEAASE